MSIPQWQGETQEFCPNAKVVLVGCKLDMRTDVGTLRELSKQRLIPITHEQVGRGRAVGKGWRDEEMKEENIAGRRRVITHRIIMRHAREKRETEPTHCQTSFNP